jgi:hypothetical protein
MQFHLQACRSDFSVLFGRLNTAQAKVLRGLSMLVDNRVPGTNVRDADAA